MKFKLAGTLVLTFLAAAMIFPPSTYNNSAAAATPGQTSAQQLAGLWQAKRRFGPDVRGVLRIKQAGGNWQAEIAGRTVAVKVAGDAVTFELPDGEAAYQGKFDARRTKITGHWMQLKTVSVNPHACPVTLAKDSLNIWRGSVSPLDDTITLYLTIKQRDDGSTGAFLKNPERNLGRFIRVDHVELDGSAVKLFAADSASEKGRLLADGRYDADGKIMSIYLPGGGGTYDFKRVGPDETSDFYPRGRPTAPYTYAPPPALNDGWQTASLETAGFDRDRIAKFIQKIIDTPIDSLRAQEDHGILIARHGKLVLEEYFHGENRDKPHDTRSASKSMTATLFGAAIKAGVTVDISTPVYKVMNGGTFPPGLDPRKKALTVENLLTMSSGLDCDDDDSNSPGNENVMQEQTKEPDWYKYTLDLKMVRAPGEKSVYCSIQPNLVGGVLQRASGRSLPVLFQDLIAGPLGIKDYFLFVTPARDAYMGGGVQFLPRDFIKLGQLHLSGGVWNGRRVLTPEWVRRSTSQHTVIGTGKYGYLWWIEDYPYKGRTVRAFYASGNGGQTMMVIPDLDLVVEFWGGNYADAAARTFREVYVPQYILPAINN